MSDDIEYKVRPGRDGGFQVVGFQPVVVGEFPEHANAKVFLEALALLKKPSPNSPAPLPTHQPVPETSPEPAQQIASKPKPSTLDRLASKPGASRPARPETDMVPVRGEPTDADWATALDRIAGGETVSNVADQSGLPFGKLRSKWAMAVKNKTHQKGGSDTPASGGVGAVLARGRPAESISDQAHENAVARLMQEDGS